MRIVNSCLTVVAALLIRAPVYGDTVIEPFSHARVSPNGKYLFVMIAPGPSERDGIGLRPEDQEIGRTLRAKYDMSGLYRNDGSTTPLWTVNWYADLVLIASDGIHLVRRGPWAENSSTEAFSFFENGKEIRSYRVGDLVDTTLTLPHTVSHFIWEQSMSLDDSNRMLTVITLNKDRYVIDITTGNVISAYRPIRIGASITACLLVIAIAFIVLRRRRRTVAV
jgi:hypothetical protein